MNTASSDAVMRDDREADLARARERGLARRLAVLDVARDVLGDDDRVVDDEARSRS